jgi:O-antigen/teichoic acid export membrane protein
MATSFITFPILTRVLPIKEYGYLALVSSSILLAVNLSKFGLNHSAVRFYEEFRTSTDKKSIAEYYSTLFIFPIVIGLIVGLFFLSLPRTMLDIDINIVKLLSFVAVLIPVRASFNLFLSFLRAEQRTKFYNFFNVISRYGSTLLSIGVLVYLINSLYGFYIGVIIAELTSLFFAIFILIKNKKIYLTNFSIGFLKESIRYGFPLFAYEIVSTLLSYSDRFLIQYYLNSEFLATYTVGSNCSTYISDLFIVPLRIAIIPIYIEIWVNRGEEATKQFLSKILKYFLLLALPIIFGIISIKKDIITILASTKYIQSHEIIPYIITGSMIYGTNCIFAAGIYIYKKTFMLTFSVCFACFLNIVLNIFLIPNYGILGAAISTLIAYLILITINLVFSFRSLKFKIEYHSLLSYTFFASIMFLIINNIAVSSQWINLFLKIGSGVLIYSFLIITFDSELRNKLIRTLRNFK